MPVVSEVAVASILAVRYDALPFRALPLYSLEAVRYFEGLRPGFCESVIDNIVL